MAKAIKWTNKFSNESGYVKSVKKADGHFVNTYDVSEAKVYSRQYDLDRAMKTLEDIGETENNTFEIIDL